MSILQEKNLINAMVKEILKDMSEEEKKAYLNQLEELKGGANNEKKSKKK